VIDYRKNKLEEQMLTNLYKKTQVFFFFFRIDSDVAGLRGLLLPISMPIHRQITKLWLAWHSTLRATTFASEKKKAKL